MTALSRALLAFAVVFWLGGNAVIASSDTPAAAGSSNSQTATGDRQVSSTLPDMSNIGSLLHRVGTNNSVIASLATVLKLGDNSNWRCREMYLDPMGEPNTRYTLMLGRDAPDDMVYFKDDVDHYIAIHAKTDGAFVTAVDVEVKTGKGMRLDWYRTRPLLEQEIAAWNEAARTHCEQAFVADNTHAWAFSSRPGFHSSTTLPGFHQHCPVQVGRDETDRSGRG